MDITILLFVVAGIGALVFAYMYYDMKVNKNKSGVINVLLFEKVGKTEVFLGSFKGETSNDEKLGLFIKIKKKNIIVDMPDYNCFYHYKNSKAVMVCKYDDDDYRIIHKLNDNTYYSKVERLVVEEREVVDEDGSVSTELVPKLDDLGEPVYELVEDRFVEPIGITQEAREVARFRRDYHVRMAELKKTKQGFFDKYGAMIANFTLALMFIIAMIYVYNKSVERDKYWADKFDENAKDYLTTMNNPSWVENVIDRIENRKVVDNTPPSVK